MPIPIRFFQISQNFQTILQHILWRTKHKSHFFCVFITRFLHLNKGVWLFWGSSKVIFVKISECYQVSLKNFPYLKDFMACLYCLVFKYNSIRRVKNCILTINISSQILIINIWFLNLKVSLLECFPIWMFPLSTVCVRLSTVHLYVYSVIHEVLTDCFNDKEMTIYNQRDGQAVPQPSVRVEEIPTLSEIYNEDYPPVYFDFDGMIGKSNIFTLLLYLLF